MAENNKAFHKAAQRPAPQFDFETVVDETYTRLPELRDKVFFIDVSQGKIAHPDPDVVKELIDLFQNSDAGHEHLQPRIRSLLETKTSYCQINGPGGGFVMLYTTDDRRSFTTTGESVDRKDQEMFFIFDHELAHAIIPEGRSDNRFTAETAADAYAAVRHFQRFGRDSGLIDEMRDTRTQNTFFEEGGIFNFSSPALTRIIEDAKTVPFEKFSEAETVAYVSAVAQQHSPDGQTLRSLYDAYAAIKEQPSLARLKNVVAKSEDAAVLTWGRVALEAFRKQETAKQEKQTELHRNHRRRISAQFNKAQSRKAVRGSQSYPALPIRRQPRRTHAYSQVGA
jgi:hypothetical protein